MRVCSFALVLFCLLPAPAIAGPPPYTDADIIGLDISGNLLADPATVSQVALDLNAIHAAFPGWIDGVDFIHARPSWVPGELLVGLTAPAWSAYLAGTYTGLDDLNAQYGPVTVSIGSTPGHFLLLDFQAIYNPALLDDYYKLADGVAYAEPNYFFGSGSDITSSQVGHYLFKRGWGDCLSGCMYNHYWEFSVTGGNVTLVSEYGTPTLTGVGDTPAPASLLGNTPNPFGTTTDIAYRVAGATHVQLRVYDISGRLVRSLRDNAVGPGTYAARWDGTDESGRRVASGVYFVNLVAGSVTQTHKMLVIR